MHVFRFCTAQKKKEGSLPCALFAAHSAMLLYFLVLSKFAVLFSILKNRLKTIILSLSSHNPLEGGQHQHITVTAEDGSVVSTHQIIVDQSGAQHHIDEHGRVVQIHPPPTHHILLQHGNPSQQPQQLQAMQLQPSASVQTNPVLHFRQE